MLKRLVGLAIILQSLACSLTFAQTVEVKVGGYLFHPFIQMKRQDASGLTIDLIELLNQQQSQYHFSFIPTSPNRRYNDFKRGVFDAIFFENISWSWDKREIEASNVFLTGGEVFFTHKIRGRNKHYFDDISNKSIVAILGFHYRFLDNITDTNILKKKFNIKLVNTPQTVMNQVLNDKTELGIASYSYLQQQIKHNPQLNDILLINDKFDQHYEHTILIRKNHPLNAKKINKLLAKIQQNGSLNKLLEKYGLATQSPSN